MIAGAPAGIFSSCQVAIRSVPPRSAPESPHSKYRPRLIPCYLLATHRRLRCRGSLREKSYAIK